MHCPPSSSIIVQLIEWVWPLLLNRCTLGLGAHEGHTEVAPYEIRNTFDVKSECKSYGYLCG